jgi:hypothetical protein
MVLNVRIVFLDVAFHSLEDAPSIFMVEDGGNRPFLNVGTHGTSQNTVPAVP